MAPPEPAQRFTTLLGQLTYFAGWAEHTLGELTILCGEAPVGDSPEGWGLSGTRLVDQLKLISLDTPLLPDVIARYEDLSEWRNRMIHSGWTFQGADRLVGWHARVFKKEVKTFSYSMTYEHLTELTHQWAELSRDVDRLITQAMASRTSAD